MARHAVRDPKTKRFVKAVTERDLYPLDYEDTSEEPQMEWPKLVMKQEPRVSRFRRFVSHNRVELIFYPTYVILCFVMGALGGIWGVRVAMGGV